MRRRCDRARARNRGTSRPIAPDGLQRAIDFVEDRAFFLLTRDGFYPKIGSLTTGSGFALGPRLSRSGHVCPRGVAEVVGRRNLQEVLGHPGTCRLSRGTAGSLHGRGGRRPARVPERGVLRSRSRLRAPRTRIEFGLRTSEVAGRAGVRPVDPLFCRGRTRPVYVESVFESVGTELDYVRSRGYVEVDYREPLNARRGGWYRLDVSHYDDTQRRPAELHARRSRPAAVRRRSSPSAACIAIRGWVSSTTEAADDSLGVPFYLMPTLGGNDSLRGFRNYRFRGPHALLLQAEYRWEIWSGLDAALFYDAGKVAMRRDPISISRISKTTTASASASTPSTASSCESTRRLAASDGKHLHIVFGGVF